jgi:hypothetical protein
MTFDALESSRALGRPLSLYFFRYGDTDDAYFAYTDAEKGVSFTFDADLGPVLFEAIAIQRTAITVSGTLDKAALTVTTPDNTDLAGMFMDHPPSQVVILTIWDAHLDATGEALDDAVLAWSGRVIGHAGEGNETTYTCEPVSTSLKRPGLTRNYQIHCPLALYQQGWGFCNADQAAATISLNATSVDGPLVSLASDWADSALKPKYIGGLATWVRADGRTEIRTIVRQQSDDVLLLSGVASGLAPGIELKLALGCNHDLDGCTLHDNIQNYGGEWLIPTNNPFGIKNDFY